MIEVLAVVAIIAVVAAILLPVLARSKEEAKKTDDISRLRQLGGGSGHLPQQLRQPLRFKHRATSG